MLRGYVKSNLQYTLINSKTRNGTFGLKGWVSSHSFTLSFLELVLYISKLIMGLVVKLQVEIAKKYPFIYSIFLFLYSEYLAIVTGNL
jgi:hypothetical protein